jgi:hypothetical protein
MPTPAIIVSGWNRCGLAQLSNTNVTPLCRAAFSNVTGPRTTADLPCGWMEGIREMAGLQGVADELGNKEKPRLGSRKDAATPKVLRINWRRVNKGQCCFDRRLSREVIFWGPSILRTWSAATSVTVRTIPLANPLQWKQPCFRFQNQNARADRWKEKAPRWSLQGGKYTQTE